MERVIGVMIGVIGLEPCSDHRTPLDTTAFCGTVPLLLQSC